MQLSLLAYSDQGLIKDSYLKGQDVAVDVY